MKRIAILLILLMMVVLSGCAGDKTPQRQEPKTPTQEQQTAAEKVKVTLYFANQNADGLMPVERQIDKPNDMVTALVSELKKPDKNTPVLPEGSELIYYKTEGDTLVLNFNQAFANLQGSTGEFITINSLANTFTELPQYKNVKLMVEGKTLETGHAIYDKPIPRNEGIIKE